MYVFSIFEHSFKLELAISELEQHHIKRKDILAVPMNRHATEKTYFDPYNMDGLNMYLISITATICMLLGVIYGFVLYWGPVLWGCIGLAAGTAVGFIIDKLVKKSSRRKKLKANINDVILLVKCSDSHTGKVEEILISHEALSIAFVDQHPVEPSA